MAEKHYHSCFIRSYSCTNTSGNYELAFNQLGNAAGFYFDRNNFPAAMQAYRTFANFADPYTTIDPSEDKDEVIRKSTIVKDMSRNYVKFMLRTYLFHPDICRANNCMDLAWDMLEKLKSRLLRVALINSAMSRLDLKERQQVEGLIARVKKERLARNELRMATGNLLGPTEKDATIAALDAEIARHLPEYTSLASEILNARTVRESLAENETLLSFFYANNERHVYVLKLQKDDPPNAPPKVIETKIFTADLFFAIEDLKEAIASGASLEQLSPKLASIYRDLIEPLQLPPNRRLIIAVDQNLSALPFDLLPWGNGQRMIDAFDITYVPSANIFYHLRQNRLASRTKDSGYQFDYGGFGYAGSEGDSLIHTETEIDNASRSMPKSFAEPNATEFKIYKRAIEIANARYLHFATHNYLVEGVDASFYLAFGGGEGEDGHLTSQEIITRLRNNADLTVLSSCETAPANDTYTIGQITPLDPQNSRNGYSRGILSGCVCSYGESFSNLTGAFFASGSKQLLLTQWRIRDDAKTDVFISRFFRLVAGGASPSNALKEAKKAMRNEKPVLWAGFVLAGD
jgi:CHAT domain-containing protein